MRRRETCKGYQQGISQKKGIKKGQGKNPVLNYSELCTLYSAAAKASGTYMHSLRLSVNLALYAEDIGLPDCIRSSVRVTHIISEMNSLAANITLSHYLTSRRYLHNQYIVRKRNICILSKENQYCKEFFEILTPLVYL